MKQQPPKAQPPAMCTRLHNDAQTAQPHVFVRLRKPTMTDWLGHTYAPAAVSIGLLIARVFNGG